MILWFNKNKKGKFGCSFICLTAKLYEKETKTNEKYFQLVKHKLNLS